MTLDALSQGFRDRYLDYDALTAQLRVWADHHPKLARLRSLAKTEEGRDLWMLTIGPDPEEARPAIWIDGNMHASEWCGSSAALAVAEDALRLHLEPSAHPPHVLERLKKVLFHIVPRISPDGAEAVMKTGRYLRSVPRDRRPNKSHARWIGGDVDGDGIALVMRKEDPTGEFSEAADAPNLLVPRQLEDAGPHYKLYPEGMIENFDGISVPSPGFLADNEPDLNRNFPHHWAPEPEQPGAGAYPGSEAESRAIIEFASRTPSIFAWINFHTFGGVFIRPLGDKPDNKMDQQDLALFRQAAAWAEELTGYPTVSGFEEFLYEPEKPLHGDLSDFAYHQRGCFAVAVELWDLFRQAGIERKKKFVDYYTHLTRAELVRIARWDAEKNASRAIRPWKKFQHPQLGEVEIGGMDPRVGFWNPPYDALAEVCARMSRWVMRVAALAPALTISAAVVTPLGGELSRVEVTVENRGYLPTNVLSSAKPLAWNEPIALEVKAERCALTAPEDARKELGHLDGWGRGLFDGTGALYHARSRGSTGTRRTGFVVRGRGVVTVRAGSCRTGWIERRIEIS